jgi:hypothetical protein
MYCSQPIQGGMKLSLFQRPLSMDIGRMKRDVRLEARLGSLKSEPVKKPMPFPINETSTIVIAV